MIFLIAKMFIYLLLAAGIGFAAGWLLRNLQAQQSEEKAQRAVHDVKSKLPQLESLLRGRDDQIVRLQAEIRERRQEHKETAQALSKVQAELQNEQQRRARLEDTEQVTNELLDGVDDEAPQLASDDSTDGLIAELSQEIASLKETLEATTQELAKAQQQAEQAAAQASAADQDMRTARGEAETIRQQLADAEASAARANQAASQAPAEPAADATADAELAQELAATRQHMQELEATAATASAELQRQKNVITELERERDLQNKSLKVMHQQLQLERSKRLANG